jgi:hypothetical protein
LSKKLPNNLFVENKTCTKETKKVTQGSRELELKSINVKEDETHT